MSEINLTRVGSFSLKKQPSVFAEVVTDLPEDTLLAILPADIMLDRAFIFVEEAYTSAGAVTADVGTTEGGSDILSGVDLKVLGQQGSLAIPVLLSNPKIFITITAPSGFTAGKIIPTLIYLEYFKNNATYTELTNIARYPTGWILDDGTWNCSGFWICSNTYWRCG